MPCTPRQRLDLNTGLSKTIRVGISTPKLSPQEFYNLLLYIDMVAYARDNSIYVQTAPRKHDLRHSFASRALALGESLPMIGKLLGHTQVQTTARYAHLQRDSIKASASRIAGSIGADIRKREAEAPGR